MIRTAAALALVGTAVVAPPADKASVMADGPCQVTSWSMTWGFKESFRAYLSGAIAGG